MTETRADRTPRIELRTRIVEAAARLLQEQGTEGVTTRAVAQAAGVQAPAIYRLFGDKDGLLDAVAEHQLARYVTDKSSVAETDDPVADMRAAWTRHIRFGLENGPLHAILTDPRKAARSPTAEAGLDVLRGRVRRIAAAGRLRVPERLAVELIHAAGVGAVSTLLAQPPADRDERVADQLYDAVVGVLLAEPPTAGSDGVLGAAVTLRAAVPEAEVLSPAEQALMVEWLDRLAAAQKPSRRS